MAKAAARPARTFEEGVRCPESPGYYVTESGKVGRIGKPGWLKPQALKRGGYLAVSLWEGNRERRRTVHQLVAIAFLGPRPSPGHEVAHGDGDKLNNHWTNLRWATRAENESDKVRHGTSNRGERNGRAKLNEAQVAEIRRRLAAGEKQGGVAAAFGVSQSCISLIKGGIRRGR